MEDFVGCGGADVAAGAGAQDHIAFDVIALAEDPPEPFLSFGRAVAGMPRFRVWLRQQSLDDLLVRRRPW